MSYFCKSRFKRTNFVIFISLLLVLFLYNYEHIKNLKKNNNNEIIKKEKVLCLILTSEKSLIRRGIPVWNTWAKNCDKALFACNCKNLTKHLSSKDNNALELPIWQLDIIEDYKNMGAKVFKILKEAYDNYVEGYKWFILTDDDTYIFTDNLFSFIKNKSINEPVTYGYNINRYTPTGYQSGGAGVLFTKESLRRITLNIRNGICNQTKGYGDVALGRCIYTII